MDANTNIKPIDLKLFPLAVLPGLVAFEIAALALSDRIWIFWLIGAGGWYLVTLLWWTLYQHHIIGKERPDRSAFYIYCIGTQLGVTALVILGFNYAI